jgi:DNA adenine methylase
VYAYDINLDLINVFKNVRDNKDLLYEHLCYYINEYTNITGNIVNRTPKDLVDARSSRESYYYWVRGIYNNIDKSSVECSALFIFLNKTCFRGIYREGPNGFNVPYGHYKKCPSFMSKLELDNISRLIKDVIFIHADFTQSLSRVNDDDFIYLDPPYFPENKKSFVGYVANGFDIEFHYKLFKQIKDLEFVKFMLNNSRVAEVLIEFDKYIIEDIIARRAINCKNPGSVATEVIIRNFRN